MGSKRNKKVKPESETVDNGASKHQEQFFAPVNNNENNSEVLNVTKSKKKKKVVEQPLVANIEQEQPPEEKPKKVRQKKRNKVKQTVISSEGKETIVPSEDEQTATSVEPVNLSGSYESTNNISAIPQSPNAKKKVKSKKTVVETVSDTVNKINEPLNNNVTKSISEHVLPEENRLAVGIADKQPELDWPEEDLNELINRIGKLIPEKDVLAYSTRIDKLSWNDIAFGKYTSTQCKDAWILLQKPVRKFRLLAEVLIDAKEWLKKPRKTKIKRHPDMPRRPQTSYMIFYLKKKNKILAEHPGIDAQELTKHVSVWFKALTPEKRAKYDHLAAVQREQYNIKLQQFYELHPELKPKTREVIPKEKIPKPPRTPKPPKVIKPPKPPKVIKPPRPPKESPEKVPRPQTPFYCFYLSELKNAGNSLETNKNVFKEHCKEKWRLMTDKQKLEWINWAEYSQKVYEANIENYMGEHPEFTPKPLKPILSKEEMLLKDRVAGKPVKPPNSSYSLFSKQYLSSEEIKSVDPKERLNHVSKKWRLLPESEKKKYQEEVAKSMAEYKVAFQLYLETLPADKREEEIQKSQVKRKMKKDSKDEPPSKKRRVKKQTKFKEPEQPPISAYKFFIKEHPENPNPLVAWKGLSPAERDEYEQELTKRKREYIVNFEKFLKSLTKEELEEYSKSRKQLSKSDDDDSSNSSSGSEDSGEEDDNSNSD